MEFPLSTQTGGCAATRNSFVFDPVKPYSTLFYTRYLGIVHLHVMVAQPHGVSFAFKVVYGKVTVIKFSSKR
jgi:hypothetical protein